MVTFRVLATVMLVAGFQSLCTAEDLDISKRAVTDPLLKIKTSSALLPEKDDKALEGRRDESTTPPMYKRILGKSDILMLEPFNRKTPAEIDFSEITTKHKGTLRISARNHPAGDFQLVILKSGTAAEKKTIGSNKWERFTIKFDHEPVVLQDAPNGWHYEFGFIDYSISTTN